MSAADPIRAELDARKAEIDAYRAETAAYRAEVQAWRQEVVVWREQTEARFDRLDHDIAVIIRHIMSENGDSE